MSSDYRKSILDLVRSEFIGPCPDENLVEDDGQEIIEYDSPLSRYSIGILYPQQLTVAEVANATSEDDDGAVSLDGGKSEEDIPSDGLGNIDANKGTVDEEVDDDPINLANAYHQSAVSLTVKIAPASQTVRIDVDFGLYTASEVIRRNNTKARVYRRSQEHTSAEIATGDLPTIDNRTVNRELFTRGSSRLGLTITNRETTDERTHGMYTFSVINEAASQSGGAECAGCFFQVEMSVTSDLAYLPLQDSVRSHADDEDYLNNQLLYRNTKTYGIGHGCAATWDQYLDEVRTVHADFMPSYEVRPIVPAKGLDFDMLDMGCIQKKPETIGVLTKLCNDYETWIRTIEQGVGGINAKLRDTARNNISKCRECLSRMKGGVALLQEDEVAFTAFCLMNEAMLSQQLHYRMPLAKWEGGQSGQYKGLTPDVDPHDRDSWPSQGVYGKWRTFQIAFILMNIRSMRDENSSERELVDLIWFPTGGGKTEAYLGLTAFTLFTRRLLDKDDGGVTVLMRYTLRLLTTQQFERASSLICACEKIREEMSDQLGEERFSIGLWVGQSTSPNTQKAAVESYRSLVASKTKDNPFILLKCPWCGAEMGVTENGKRPVTIKGYHVKHLGRHKDAFRYACSNPSCHFSDASGASLPIYAIDEDIYRHRPSLVIGTVDKFAAMATTSDTRNLFGRGEHRCSPPDLIIQDELHLISGPLGSMVGFYETAVDVLCTDSLGHHAKVVGSTATISHAKEQCAALYGRRESDISQFPPSGIDAGDSFFAVEQDDPNKPGRLYVGICSPGCSMAMSIINLYASLLLAPDVAPDDVDSKVLDGYQTNLGYFNSLRELGQAATWISGNILENLRAMQTRRWRKNTKFKGRNPNWINHCELTSRISSAEIPASLKRLEVGIDGQSRPVDVCLATNMVSVGVDIPRLALMTIDGQPKTTSEYIQASSRVGRGDNPGLVFTVYSPTKARDKSHYEDFQRYHSRLYCNVEPTSITPFSAPLRDRAMKALIVALVRQLCPFEERDDPQAPTEELFEAVETIILDRASVVDRRERDFVCAQVEALLSNWEERMPQQYTSKKTEQITPLIMRVGSEVNPNWQKESIWEVPSSMRSVDAGCTVKKIFEYVGGDEDDA
ncbi:hypothetical protein BN3658_02210 [Coriobacteriaceae bacterium CHKCI002]|nr:hypothetical protein BN3658_02210 [Coriobacteriaceae bacterium CHKCI002]